MAGSFLCVQRIDSCVQPVAEVVVCMAAALSRRIALAIILSYSSTGRANKETWIGVGAIFSGSMGFPPGFWSFSV